MGSPPAHRVELSAGTPRPRGRKPIAFVSSQNTGEIELNGWQDTLQCGHSEEHQYSRKARKINKHRGDRASPEAGTVSAWKTLYQCAASRRSQQGHGHVKIPVTARSGNVMLLQVSRPFLSPPPDSELPSLLLQSALPHRGPRTEE